MLPCEFKVNFQAKQSGVAFCPASCICTTQDIILAGKQYLREREEAGEREEAEESWSH